jgi:hypothetical protein
MAFSCDSSAFLNFNEQTTSMACFGSTVTPCSCTKEHCLTSCTAYYGVTSCTTTSCTTTSCPCTAVLDVCTCLGFIPIIFCLLSPNTCLPNLQTPVPLPLPLPSSRSCRSSQRSPYLTLLWTPSQASSSNFLTLPTLPPAHVSTIKLKHTRQHMSTHANTRQHM